MADGKKSFQLYTDLIDFVNGSNVHNVEVEAMTDEEAGKLFRWILEYVNDLHPPIPKEIKFVTAIVKRQLDDELEKYKEKCRKNTENINKRWHSNDNENIQDNTNVYERIPSDTKNTDKDKDKDKDKDNNIKENTTTINSSIKEKSAKSRFSAPTLDEVEEYAKEHALEKYNTTNSLLDCERFINHYESNGWMVGKNKMKNWKFAVNNWMATNVKDHPELLDDDIYGGFRRLDETDEDYETRQNGGFKKL